MEILTISVWYVKTIAPSLTDYIHSPPVCVCTPTPWEKNNQRGGSRK